MVTVVAGADVDGRAAAFVAALRLLRSSLRKRRTGDHRFHFGSGHKSRFSGAAVAASLRSVPLARHDAAQCGSCRAILGARSARLRSCGPAVVQASPRLIRPPIELPANAGERASTVSSAIPCTCQGGRLLPSASHHDHRHRIRGRSRTLRARSGALDQCPAHRRDRFPDQAGNHGEAATPEPSVRILRMSRAADRACANRTTERRACDNPQEPRVPGTIVPDAGQVGHVSIKPSGTVAELRKNIGDDVEG